MLGCDFIGRTYYNGGRHPDIYLRAYYLSSFLSENLWRWRWNISYLGPECVGISFQNDGDGFLANALVFNIIAASIAIAIFAILTTCKAFAVKFETSWVFAITTFTAIANSALTNRRVSKWGWKVDSLLTLVLSLRCHGGVQWTLFILYLRGI